MYGIYETLGSVVYIEQEFHKEFICICVRISTMNMYLYTDNTTKSYMQGSDETFKRSLLKYM